MKNALWLALLLAGVLEAEWEPDRRLTYDPGSSLTSRNNAWCIAAGPGAAVHAAFWDDRLGTNEVFYKRSTDWGRTWSRDTWLTYHDTARSWTPSITVADSTVHVVCFDTEDGANGEICHRRSLDAGVTWLPGTRLSHDTAKSEYPSVAASGLNVHVVWRDGRDERWSWEVYHQRSTDGGATWVGETRLTNATGIKWSPSAAVADSLVHAVWGDNRDGNWEVYYKRSTNWGRDWQTDVRLTTSVFAQQWPCVAAAGSCVHVGWVDGEDVDGEIHHTRSTDGGATWEPARRVTNGSARVEFWAPSICASGAMVHAVWHDTRDGNSELYYSRSTDQGENWALETRLTGDNAASSYPSIAASDSVLHVAWTDYRDGVLPEVYYKRNPSGNVGVEESQQPKASGSQPLATVVRGIPSLACAPDSSTLWTLVSASGRPVHACCRDPIGRDLAPGVYFLKSGSAQGTVKLVRVR